MLKVQISKGGSVSFEFKVAASFFCSDDFLNSGRFIGEIEISGEIIKRSADFAIRGEINCTKEFTCDRCLIVATETQIQTFDEILSLADIVEDFVDITELERDTLIASQPIRNVCKEDCKGLCPICGKNLNDGACECKRLSVDPRLAPLIDFKSFEEV